MWLPIVKIIKDSENKHIEVEKRNTEDEKKDNIIKRAFKEVIEFIKYCSEKIEEKNPYE